MFFVSRRSGMESLSESSAYVASSGGFHPFSVWYYGSCYWYIGILKTGFFSILSVVRITIPLFGVRGEMRVSGEIDIIASVLMNTIGIGWEGLSGYQDE
jgi:hypothetical protein